MILLVDYKPMCLRLDFVFGSFIFVVLPDVAFEQLVSVIYLYSSIKILVVGTPLAV